MHGCVHYVSNGSVTGDQQLIVRVNFRKQVDAGSMTTRATGNKWRATRLEPPYVKNNLWIKEWKQRIVVFLLRGRRPQQTWRCTVYFYGCVNLTACFFWRLEWPLSWGIKRCCQRRLSGGRGMDAWARLRRPVGATALLRTTKTVSGPH